MSLNFIGFVLNLLAGLVGRLQMHHMRQADAAPKKPLLRAPRKPLQESNKTMTD
jgi:hypothetical protein